MIEIFEELQIVTIRPYSNYRGKYAGYQGTIKRITGKSSIGVEFAGMPNKNSSYGLFWFKESDLEYVKNKNIKNESEEIKMLNGYKTVLIKFLDGTNTDKRYAYAAYNEVNENDYVVVKTGHHGWGIAQVSEILNEDYAVECGREIIAKFDPSSYFERIEKIKRLSEIKKSMDAKVKELQHLAIYEALAKDSPEMKELLDEFKSLI